MHWREWHPELSSQKTLKEVLSEMPRVAPDKIPWQVRLLENPESSVAFPGAISLFRHDCIHAILCASFHPLDEAFVIGFTMGSDKRMTKRLARFFMWLTTWFYPKKYRFKKQDLFQFAKGLAFARRSQVTNLADFRFEDYQDCTLLQLRQTLGINWLDNDQEYRQWSKRWGLYQFCINDECRFDCWLRAKAESQESTNGG